MKTFTQNIKFNTFDETKLPSYCLNNNQLKIVESLLSNLFYPINNFLNNDEYKSVLNTMKLKDNTFCPMPICLEVDSKDIDLFKNTKKLILKNEEHYKVAQIDIEDIYKPNFNQEILLNLRKVKLLKKDVYYIGGELTKFPQYQEKFYLNFTRKNFILNDKNYPIIGCDIRNPLTKFFVKYIKKLIKSIDPNAKILLHPNKIENNQHLVNRCFDKLKMHFKNEQLILSNLDIRFQNSLRSLLQKALIDKNLGCSHFVTDSINNFNFLKKYEKHLKIKPFLLNSNEKRLESFLKVEQNLYTFFKNDQIPSWYTYKNIKNVLKKLYLKDFGYCIYLTGLSGSGKSTIAKALKEKFLQQDKFDKDITLLDGDIIRKYLSQNLGFSLKDRSINVRRIGYVASLIVKNSGICICANIAPYDVDRLANRKLISKYGKYIEVFVNTPLEVCAKRDVKGLYKAALDGKIKNFTGISDPYEIPKNAEIIINGTDNLQKIVDELYKSIEKIISSKNNFYFDFL